MKNDAQMPERIWIDHNGGKWSPVAGGTQQCEYIRADLCASGQQVRALEWTPGTYTTRDDDGGKREGFPRLLFAWRAENYLIIQEGSLDGLFLLRGKSEGTGLAVPTLEAAKAAAQADYERRILAALTPAPQPSAATPTAQEAVPSCVACEDNPKHPNIPCAVCNAHPSQPSETVAEAAAVILSAIERAQIDMTILRKFMNGEPCAALRALKGGE